MQGAILRTTSYHPFSSFLDLTPNTCTSSSYRPSSTLPSSTFVVFPATEVNFYINNVGTVSKDEKFKIWQNCTYNTRDGRPAPRGKEGALPRPAPKKTIAAPPRPAKYHCCPAPPRPARGSGQTAGRLRGKMKTLKL